jgi:DNA replication and repair protein RecF
MPIRQLNIQGVRNLAPLDITPSPLVNFIYGDNGSGKTSVLEAIHLLAAGKSFRSTQVKQVLSHEQDRCEILIRIADAVDVCAPLRDLFHLRLKNGDHLFRLDDSLLSAQSQVAALLPVQVIEPNTFRLLSGSPEDRRQFLDWGVFHVEASFIDEWRLFRQTLKQRNSALKQNEPEWLDVWNQGFIESSLKIDQFRKQYLKQLAEQFQQTLHSLDPELDVRLNYYPGWERDSDLAQILERQKERDIQLGYTQAGPHRAELRITVNKIPAAEVLSRGQQKTVVSALKLAQGIVFKQQTGRAPIYLVDDLASELDARHRLALCQVLEDLKCQVFITSIEKNQLMDGWAPADFKVFHVEHGQIQEEILS